MTSRAEVGKHPETGRSASHAHRRSGGKKPPDGALRPRVVCLAGPMTRDLLFGDALLDQPGIYIGVWIARDGVKAYIGQSRTSVASRVLGSTHFRHPFDVDFLFIVTDDFGLLGHADTQALERIAYIAVEQESGVQVSGQEPFGAPVGSKRYFALREFWGQAAIRMRGYGVLFSEFPDEVLLRGASTSMSRLPTTSDLAVVRPERHVLSRGDAAAEVLEVGEGAWMLLMGSVIRRDVVSSASATASVLREEWFYAGILVPHRDPLRLELTKPVLFPSLSAAGGFAIGCKALRSGFWQRSDDHTSTASANMNPVVDPAHCLDLFAAPQGHKGVAALNDNVLADRRPGSPAIAGGHDALIRSLDGAEPSTLDIIASLVATRLIESWTTVDSRDPQPFPTP